MDVMELLEDRMTDTWSDIVDHLAAQRILDRHEAERLAERQWHKRHDFSEYRNE